MSVLWTTEELPGLAFDPEPEPDEDDNGPWCRHPTYGATASPPSNSTP